jgi:protein CpxP
MTRPWMGYLAGAAFVLSAAGAAAAYAQSNVEIVQSQAAADAKGSVQADRPDRPDRPDRNQRVERQVVVRHGQDQGERLRTLLQLKPAQEPALTAYLAAVRPDHGYEQIVEMSDGAAPRTTPQRLAQMEQHLAEQAAQGRARIEATRKFYDQLEPSQKKVFDEMPMLMIGPMGPMMPMGPMKVMVSLDGHGPMHAMDRLPPVPPVPPAPPAPPAPPRLDD